LIGTEVREMVLERTSVIRRWTSRRVDGVQLKGKMVWGGPEVPPKQRASNGGDLLGPERPRIYCVITARRHGGVG